MHSGLTPNACVKVCAFVRGGGLQTSLGSSTRAPFTGDFYAKDKSVRSSRVFPPNFLYVCVGVFRDALFYSFFLFSILYRLPGIFMLGPPEAAIERRNFEIVVENTIFPFRASIPTALLGSRVTQAFLQNISGKLSRGSRSLSPAALVETRRRRKSHRRTSTVSGITRPVSICCQIFSLPLDPRAGLRFESTGSSMKIGVGMRVLDFKTI